MLGKQVYRCLLAGALVGVRTEAWAQAQAFFSSDGVQQQLLRLIDGSRQTIDLAVFEFSSKPLAAALARARSRGVSVRLLLNAQNPQDMHLPAELAPLAPDHLRRLSGRSGHSGIMHNKFAVFDHQRVVTGSYNWTAGAEHSNYENALLEDDPQVVRAYDRQFEELWNQASAVPSNGVFALPEADVSEGGTWRRRRNFKWRFKRRKRGGKSRSIGFRRGYVLSWPKRPAAPSLWAAVSTRHPAHRV